MKKNNIHFKISIIWKYIIPILLFLFLLMNRYHKNINNPIAEKKISNFKKDSVKNENITNEKVSKECNASLYYNNKIKVDSNNVPLKKSQYYFPLKLFPIIDLYGKIVPNNLDTFLVNWYSEQLFALKEPLLFNKKMNKEVYRFTWLRTFHHPIAIRIEKENGVNKLYWKECDGAGGYEPGNLITDKSKVISKLDWDVFHNKLSRLDFWNCGIGTGLVGTDGSFWILEGATPDRYYVISEWEGKMDCCLYLLKLTDLKIPDKEIY